MEMIWLSVPGGSVFKSGVCLPITILWNSPFDVRAQ